MSSREPYRFISYDSRDEHLVQFYVHEVNSEPYINFTYISPRDKRWADIIEPNDTIFFLQDNVDASSALIQAPYDNDHGFRLAGNPSPSLVEGQYYGIDYSRDRPEEDRDIPTENRGWSPLYIPQYLTFDNPGYSLSETRTNYFCWKLEDWLSGLGTKPPLGFAGPNGLVADVNNALTFELPKGERGSRWTQGTEFPTNPLPYDFHIFTEAVTGLTNYFQSDGTTAKASAVKGEVTQWDGSKWTFAFIETIGGSAQTGLFTPSLSLGTYENNAASALAGHYRRISDTRIEISFTNDDGEDKTAEINGIVAGYGITFGDKIFVVAFKNLQNNRMEFDGYWVNNDADTTAAGAKIAINVIQHELRFLRFLDTDSLATLIGNKILSQLKPRVSVYPNAKRKDSLIGNYDIRVSDLDAIFPDVDHIKVYFDNVLVLEEDIDKTFTNSSFTLGLTTANLIKDRTPDSAGFWVLKTELFKNDGIHYTIETPVHYLLSLSAFHYYSLNRESIDVLEDKTADMFVHNTPGDFADTNNQNIVSIGAIERTAANLAAINAGTFDFTDFTYVPLSTTIPSDAANDYDIILRVRKTLADPQSHLRVYERTVGVDTNFPLRQLLSEDVDWKYYSTIEAGAGDTWIVQYRGSHPHNTFGGRLGETPLRDVDARVASGEIGKKTTDLVLTERAGVYTDADDEGVALTLLERTSANEQAVTDNNVDFSANTWDTPTLKHTDDSKQYYLVARIPKALGDIGSQFRISSTPSGTFGFTAAEVTDATYNYYLTGTVSGTISATIQREGQEDKTRYDGELGEKALEQVGSGGTGSGTTNRALENKVENLENKTSDLHVEEEQSPFADLTDANIGGIAVGVANGTTRAALKAGTYDFSALTFANPSATVPRDATSNYLVLVRVAKSLGKIEPRFRVYARDFGDGVSFPLGQLVGSDANWNYYNPTEGGPSDVWIVQYKETHSHTRYDGDLGNAALAQVDSRIPEHQSFEDLEDKTSDIHINDPPGDFGNLTDSAIGGVAALLETPQIVSAISAGTFDFTTLTWNNPSVSYSPTRGQDYRVIVRVAKTQIETQFRVLLVHAIGGTQRYYGIGEVIHSDTNWNYYTAVRGDLAATATVEYRETHTHTRYDGELGKAALEQIVARIPPGSGLTEDQLARLLPAFPAENERNGKTVRFVQNVLTWMVDPEGEQISGLADRLKADETKLENFIDTVNNYFSGQGEGDVTSDQIAHLFALLDEYNPVIDEIRSTLGLVGELGEPTRLVQEYADQTTFLSHATVPSTLPKIEYITHYIGTSRQDALLSATGESTHEDESVSFNYTDLNHVAINGGGGILDPFLRYYLNGDTDEADAIQRCAMLIVDNRVYILLQKHSGGGADPLAAFTNATLRPYISYAPLNNLAVDGTITKFAVETLAPTNADHDVSFIPSFEEELPERNIKLQREDARGWYFNNTDSGTTFNSIFAKWYSDFQWLSRMYEEYRLYVEHIDSGRGAQFDPRRQNWLDGSKNPDDAGTSVFRPPYPSLDALKAAFPIPDLTFYFKLSVDGMVMNLADHDIHRPKRNKLVQIPDTHYNTPPRVTFLPTIARENEVFQLVSDEYRPDAEHTWTFQPQRTTVNNRTVAGASRATTLGVTHPTFGVTSDTVNDLPRIFQRNAVNAFVAFADDPEHIYLYINTQITTTSDVIIVEMHGIRSNRDPIVRTATFRHSSTTGTIRRFQSRVSGAYGILDLSETISISVKRGNDYLYLNYANDPPTPEWEVGLLHTAGLYKGNPDGTFEKAVIVEEEEYDRLIAGIDTSIQGGLSAITPRRVEVLTSSGKQGDLVYLTKEYYTASDKSAIKFEPRLEENAFGVSSVDTLGLVEEGARRREYDQTLTSLKTYSGVVVQDDELWVLNNSDNIIEHYNLNLKTKVLTKDASKDITELPNGVYTDICSNGSIIWAMNLNVQTAYAFNRNDQTRNTTADQQLFNSPNPASNRNYIGIAADERYFWAVNETNDRVEAFDINPNTYALTADATKNITLAQQTTGVWGQAFHARILDEDYLYVAEEATPTSPTTILRAFKEDGASDPSKDIELETNADYAGFAVDYSTGSGGLLWALNESLPIGTLQTFDMSHSILPPIISNRGLAAIYMPFEGEERLLWHVAVHEAWTSRTPKSLHVIWGTGDRHIIENYSTDLYRASATRTINNNIYRVYAESSPPDERDNNIQRYKAEGELITMYLQFTDGTFVEVDGTTYTAGVKTDKGLYNIFDVATGYERARLLKESEALSGDAQAWTDITVGTTIPIGKVVHYDGEFYGCYAAHDKAATPTPNANDAQWRLLSTYLGGWRSGAFPKGSIVERGGHFWIAVTDVARGRPSPTGAGQTDWKRIDND